RGGEAQAQEPVRGARREHEDSGEARLPGCLDEVAHHPVAYAEMVVALVYGQGGDLRALAPVAVQGAAAPYRAVGLEDRVIGALLLKVAVRPAHEVALLYERLHDAQDLGYVLLH